MGDRKSRLVIPGWMVRKLGPGQSYRPWTQRTIFPMTKGQNDTVRMFTVLNVLITSFLCILFCAITWLVARFLS